MACKIWNLLLFLKCLLKSQIERGTSLHIRFGLPDTRRQGLSIVLAPGSSWLAAATDSFGRVLLVDVSRGCIYRTWKGSQPLNLRQAIRCERRAHCMVKLKIPLVHHAHNHEGGAFEGCAPPNFVVARNCCYIYWTYIKNKNLPRPKCVSTQTLKPGYGLAVHLTQWIFNPPTLRF